MPPAAPPDTLPTPAELESLAVDLATAAGERAAAARRAGLEVGAKSTRTDLVTEVDRDTEAWLRARIATLRPDDAVLGEEAGGQGGTSGVRWILDPIDGTVNFVLGLPQYAVSVAAEVAGTVVAGAVANPVSGEVFRASAGGGAYLGDERLHGPRAVPLDRAVIGTGFGYDSERRARQATVVARLLPNVADIRRLGAASLDLCFVACARLDGFFEVGLNVWDHAAGGLVAAEAGCVASGLRGAPPSSHFYAVTGPELAGEFFAALAELGADRVSS